MKLFGLLISLQNQKDLVTKFCFGKCGKILVGGIMTEDVGPLFPCKCEECLYEEARLQYPGKFTFPDDPTEYEVWLRKLKDNGDGSA